MKTDLKFQIAAILFVHLLGVQASGSDVAVFFGSDSNPARAPGGYSGSYYQLAPKFEKSLEQFNDTSLNLYFGANLKKFNDERVALSSDSHLLTGGASLVNKYWKKTEVEVGWGFEYLNARIAPSNFDESSGEASVYLAQKLNVGLTYLGPASAFTLGAKLSWKDFSTEIFDEQNNTFEDDNVEQGLFTKWVLGFVPNMKFELGAEWSKQSYRYRSIRGEYGIGRADGPQLILENQEYYLAWLPQFTQFESTTALALGIERDAESGRSDLTRQKIEQKFVFPFSGRHGLSLKTEISLLRRQFSYIRSNLSSPEEASESDFRRDLVSQFSVGIAKSFGSRVEGIVVLSYFDSSSNFKDEVYMDRSIKTGLTAKF